MEYFNLKNKIICSILTVILLVVFIKTSNAQNKPFVINLLNNNKESKNISINTISDWLGNKSGVVFFCPINDVFDSIVYANKAQNVFYEFSKPMYANMEITFVLYKIENASANNPHIIFESNKIRIENMEIILFKPNPENLSRANSIFAPNIFIDEKRRNESIVFIEINRKEQCFNEWPDRIPFVKDFLSEVFIPNYENKEAFNKIISELKLLNERNDSIANDLKLIQNKIQLLYAELNKISFAVSASEKFLQERNRLTTIINNLEHDLNVLKMTHLNSTNKSQTDPTYDERVKDLEKNINIYKDKLNSL